MLKYKFFSKILPFFTLIFLCACQSSRIEKIEEKLFRVQTRILHMDTDIVESMAKIQSSDQNYRQQQAHSEVNNEKYKVDVQRLRGEIDILRQGVIKGRLPDQAENEPSIAFKISELDKKINSLESTQKELLELIKKINIEKKSENKKVNRTKLNTLKSFQKAFKLKRYLHVVEDYPVIKGEIRKKDTLEMKYLYSESLFKLGRIDEAAISYSELMEKKDLASRSSKVYLRLGDCFRFLGENKTALLYYQDLLRNHPKTEEAGYAKKYIDKLKSKI